MTHAPGGLSRIVLASLALMCAGAMGCHDESVAPRAPTPPIDQMANLGTYIVDVDVRANTVTVHPMGQSMSTPSGVTAMFYGTPSQINHVFTAPPGVSNPVPIAGGEHLYILRERIENGLNFAVGTPIAHTAPAFPEDTMGVFVYMPFPVFGITGIGCPTSCTVTVDSVDGHGSFTATNQPYWYWRTILEGSDGNVHSGPDFSDQIVGPAAVPGGIDYYRDLVFHLSPPVTGFSFGVSVSAPWVMGNGETGWTVTYPADSLPNRLSLGPLTSASDLRTEPDWRFVGTPGALIDTSMQTVACPSGTSCLKIASAFTALATDTGSFFYYRSDSLGATQDGFIAATISASTLAVGPTVFFGMQDNAKLILFGLANGLAGFTDATGAFISPTFSTAGLTQFRVAKHGSTDVAVYSPSSSTAPLTTLAYTSLPTANAFGAPSKPFFLFGNHSTHTEASTSMWSNVVYGIGTSGP